MGDHVEPQFNVVLGSLLSGKCLLFSLPLFLLGAFFFFFKLFMLKQLLI